jgi:hypothetical protein
MDTLNILRKHRPSMYNVMVWDAVDGESIIISEHTIFVGRTGSI